MSLTTTGGTVPPGEGRGYADAALLAGRPVGSIVHIVALALAAVADIGQFYGVIKLALPELTETAALAIVLGFTAVVLFLAHAAGVTFRDRRAGVRAIPAAVPWLCVTGWLLLGAVAVFVRLMQTGNVGVGVIDRGSGAAAATPDGLDLHFGPAPLMFLSLYVATGLVAGVGGYLSHNPARSAYLRARIARSRAMRRAARAALAMQTANGNRQLQESYQREASDVLQRGIERQLALAEEMKQYARVVMAQRAADPAMTDALFTADRNPYQPPPSK